MKAKKWIVSILIGDTWWESRKVFFFFDYLRRCWKGINVDRIKSLIWNERTKGCWWIIAYVGFVELYSDLDITMREWITRKNIFERWKSWKGRILYKWFIMLIWITKFFGTCDAFDFNEVLSLPSFWFSLVIRRNYSKIVQYFLPRSRSTCK